MIYARGWKKKNIPTLPRRIANSVLISISRYGCIEPVCIGLDRGICPDDKKDCPLNIELIKL